MIDGVEAIRRLGSTGSGVVVGHLDTMVDVGHEVFAPCGRVDSTIVGYRGLGSSTCTTSFVSSAWHGTHTAALMVGAPSGDGRFCGIAPGAELVTVAVIEEGDVVARILAGLDRLLGTDVGVVNLSIGLPGDTPVLRSAVRALVDRDVVVVAPIGNGAAGKSTAPGLYPECLSVGAVDAVGQVAAFSGSAHEADFVTCRKPDVVAPGVEVVSAVPGGYAAKTGTSMASAAVAGLAALLRSAHPCANAADIVEAIVSTASARCTGQEHRSRTGMINPLAAHRRLSERRPRIDAEPGPTPPGIGQRPETWIDPRLRLRLAASGHSDRLDAVLEFESRVAAEEAFWSIKDADPVAEVRLLECLPTIIGRTMSHVVADLTARATMRAASACDVDRWA